MCCKPSVVAHSSNPSTWKHEFKDSQNCVAKNKGKNFALLASVPPLDPVLTVVLMGTVMSTVPEYTHEFLCDSFEMGMLT